MTPAFAAEPAAEGGFERTLWHEIGHYLGPERARDGRPLDQALAGWADALEEMKADLVSLFAVHRLADGGPVTAESLRAVQAAGILRTLNSTRPRRDQPYQTMQLAQLNWFLEHGLLSATDDAHLELHRERYAATVEGLLAEVLRLQLAGDPAAAETFFNRWTNWTETLHAPLAARLRAAEGDARYRLPLYAALGD
jgi:hypothetical protein